VKRIQISHIKCWVGFLGTFLVLCRSHFRRLFQLLTDVLEKYRIYNELRADFDRLRGRYQKLQQVFAPTHAKQMASLETLASEVVGRLRHQSADIARSGADGR